MKREVLNFRGKLFQSLLAITEKEWPASLSLKYSGVVKLRCPLLKQLKLIIVKIAV